MAYEAPGWMTVVKQKITLRSKWRYKWICSRTVATVARAIHKTDFAVFKITCAVTLLAFFRFELPVKFSCLFQMSGKFRGFQCTKICSDEACYIFILLFDWSSIAQGHMRQLNWQEFLMKWECLILTSHICLDVCYVQWSDKYWIERQINVFKSFCQSTFIWYGELYLAHKLHNIDYQTGDELNEINAK